jgi:hypothetical protein
MHTQRHLPAPVINQTRTGKRPRNYDRSMETGLDYSHGRRGRSHFLCLLLLAPLCLSMTPDPWHDSICTAKELASKNSKCFNCEIQSCPGAWGKQQCLLPIAHIRLWFAGGKFCTRADKSAAEWRRVAANIRHD